LSLQLSFLVKILFNSFLEKTPVKCALTGQLCPNPRSRARVSARRRARCHAAPDLRRRLGPAWREPRAVSPTHADQGFGPPPCLSPRRVARRLGPPAPTTVPYCHRRRRGPTPPLALLRLEGKPLACAYICRCCRTRAPALAHQTPCRPPPATRHWSTLVELPSFPAITTAQSLKPLP
jgi:hypothetical protein